MFMTALVGRKVLKVLGGFVMGTLLVGFSQSAYAEFGWPHMPDPHDMPYPHNMPSPTIPSKGVCGFTMSPQYPFVYLYGSTPGTNWSVAVLGTIDLSNKVVHTNVISQNPAGSSTTETQSSSSDTFTGPNPGPFPGSYTITTSNYVINIVPVKYGSTLLLQRFNTTGSQDGGFVGQCQF
jgi:hypothetical protein